MNKNLNPLTSLALVYISRAVERAKLTFPCKSLQLEAAGGTEVANMGMQRSYTGGSSVVPTRRRDLGGEKQDGPTGAKRGNGAFS